MLKGRGACATLDRRRARGDGGGVWLGHERRQRRQRRRRRQEHADHEGDHRQPAGLEGADRRLQEGEPGRHDQGDVRADRPAPDRAARAARRAAARRTCSSCGPATAARCRSSSSPRPACSRTSATRTGSSRSRRARARCSASSDKTYIWSPSTTPIGVIYNKKVFEDAGVDKLPDDLSRVPRREREDQEGRQDPGRGRPPDALGHAADPVRDRAGDRLRRRPEPREGHAGRQEVVHQLRVGRGLQALPRPREARLLQPQPERHHLRAADGDGGQRQGGDGDPGDRDAARLPRRGQEPGRHRHLPVPGERQGRRAEDRGRHLGRARRERQDAEDGRREGVREVARRAGADGHASPRAATRCRSSPPATSSIRWSSRSCPT